MVEDVPAVHIVGIGDGTNKAVVRDTELAPISTVVAMISQNPLQSLVLQSRRAPIVMMHKLLNR